MPTKMYSVYGNIGSNWASVINHYLFIYGVQTGYAVWESVQVSKFR